MEGKAAEVNAQSCLSFDCWFTKSLAAWGGRSSCRDGGQRRGMESSNVSWVGRTACHGARIVEVSRVRSVARRL